MADFAYYHGSDAEQFNFFRLPKRLVRDKRFEKLTSEAKILYGVLLDRMTLSAQNGWVDDENRVYIIYTTREVMQEFNCSERKAIMLMGELDTKKGIGLIEKKRQGLGRPNIIYVKNFNSVTDEGETMADGAKDANGAEVPTAAGRTEEERKGFERTASGMESGSHGNTWKRGENIGNGDSGAVVAGSSQEGLVKKDVHMREGEPRDFQTCKGVQVKTCKNVQVKTCKSVQVKTCKSVQVKNETDKNETDIKQYPSINPSNKLLVYADGDGRMDGNAFLGTRGEESVLGMPNKESVMAEFKKRLGYDALVCDFPEDRARIENLFLILTDAYCQGGESQSIGGGEVATADVRQRLGQLNPEHARYVLWALKNNTTKIRNIRKYVLTSLYNAPATMGLYYQNAVAHDMAAGTWKGGT